MICSRGGAGRAGAGWAIISFMGAAPGAGRPNPRPGASLPRPRHARRGGGRHSAQAMAWPTLGVLAADAHKTGDALPHALAHGLAVVAMAGPAGLAGPGQARPAGSPASPLRPPCGASPFMITFSYFKVTHGGALDATGARGACGAYAAARPCASGGP